MVLFVTLAWFKILAEAAVQFLFSVRATLTAHRNKSGVADYAVKMQLIQCLPGTSFHTRSVVREVCLFLLLPMTGSSVHSIVATWECVLLYTQPVFAKACLHQLYILSLPASHMFGAAACCVNCDCKPFEIQSLFVVSVGLRSVSLLVQSLKQESSGKLCRNYCVLYSSVKNILHSERLCFLVILIRVFMSHNRVSHRGVLPNGIHWIILFWEFGMIQQYIYMLLHNLSESLK